MIYPLVKAGLLALLKAPAGPPPVPAGSPGSEQVFRASRKFLVYKLVLTWGGAVLPTLFGVGMALAGDSGSWIVGGLIAALALGGALLRHFLVRLDYDLRYYVVTDRALRIRQGAMIIHEATYTFANIQNVQLHQGPVERLLGISNLQIQTAGGGSPTPQEQGGGHAHRSVLQGIENAGEVRNLILALMKKFRDAGLGDPEDARRAAPAAAPAAGLPVERLREILAEAKGMRAALGA